MAKEETIVAELNDDISWGDLEESYSLHLHRGYSFCSSISASSAFVSLYDEIVEEWIDNDGNVYLVEESEILELRHDSSDRITSCRESSHQEGAKPEMEIFSPFSEEATDWDLRYGSREKAATTSLRWEPSHHEEEERDFEVASLDSEEATDWDLRYGSREKVASDAINKSREAKQQNGRRRKSSKKNKTRNRPAFLRSLSTLSRIGKRSSQKTPKQFTNAAA